MRIWYPAKQFFPGQMVSIKLGPAQGTIVSLWESERVRGKAIKINKVGAQWFDFAHHRHLEPDLNLF
jgi:hypothetical protein